MSTRRLTLILSCYLAIPFLLMLGMLSVFLADKPRAFGLYVDAVHYIAPLPETNSKLELPKQFRRLSEDGRVYVTQSGKHQYVVFRTARGRGLDFAGLLYCSSRVFRPGDALRVYTGPPDDSSLVRVEVTSVRNEEWYEITTGFLN